MKSGEKVYGVADKAWQVVVGCSPNMPCAPRCWARRTVARVVSCQEASEVKRNGTVSGRSQFYRIALTPDGQRWSGEVRLDELHLAEPLGWTKPALIATGFHGDWGRLDAGDQLRILGIIAKCQQHEFMLLSKCPDLILESVARRRWRKAGRFYLPLILSEHEDRDARALPNATLGVSVMNQAEADKYRVPMEELARLGWSTHVWFEPAIGPVNWRGWEFTKLIIAGGESGPGARPSDVEWYRRTRDWCEENGITFIFKQWGSWAPATGGMMQVDKRTAGCVLDGREWKDLPKELTR